MIVKYARKENAQHLINAIKSEGYKLSIDWGGAKYCGIDNLRLELRAANPDNLDARVRAENVAKIQA